MVAVTCLLLVAVSLINSFQRNSPWENLSKHMQIWDVTFLKFRQQLNQRSATWFMCSVCLKKCHLPINHHRDRVWFGSVMVTISVFLLVAVLTASCWLWCSRVGYVAADNQYSNQSTEVPSPIFMSLMRQTRHVSISCSFQRFPRSDKYRSAKKEVKRNELWYFFGPPLALMACIRLGMVLISLHNVTTFISTKILYWWRESRATSPVHPKDPQWG